MREGIAEWGNGDKGGFTDYPHLRFGNSDSLYILGSKITADGDCSHETERRLLLGRKVMTNLDSIL